MADERTRDLDNVLKTVEVADRAAGEGRHPFGAILVNERNEVVAEQGNIDTINHAEMTLARTACTPRSACPSSE